MIPTSGRNFAQEVTAAARVVARLEARRRTARKRLAELDEQYREARRNLNLLVQTVEPYEPPPPGAAAVANEQIDAIELR